jgi:hypothetical protein
VLKRGRHSPVVDVIGDERPAQRRDGQADERNVRRTRNDRERGGAAKCRFLEVARNPRRASASDRRRSLSGGRELQALLHRPRPVVDVGQEGGNGSRRGL